MKIRSTPLLAALVLMASAATARAQDGVSVKDDDGTGVDISGGNIKLKGTDGTLTVKGAATGGSVASSGKYLKVEGFNKTMTHTCGGEGANNIRIEGSGHKITLRGDCVSVRIEGWGNTVTIEGIGSLKVEGKDQKVRWVRGIGGKKPSIKSEGVNNSVSKIEPDDL